MRDGSHRLARGTTCGHPEREGRVDKRWRLAGGGAVQVDGHSAPGRVGGEKQVQLESKAASTGGSWGSDGSLVRKKTRYPETVKTGGAGGD